MSSSAKLAPASIQHRPAAIDIRPVNAALGILIAVLGTMMMVPAIVDLAHGHDDWIVFTVSAAVRFKPEPPALRLIKNTGMVGSCWNRSMRSERSCVEPSRYS